MDSVRHLTPWGSWQVLAEGREHKVKRIEVKPGHRFSLQWHNRRDEHWVVVSGQARIEIGDKIVKAKPGKYIFIPKKTKHRLQNPGKNRLVVIEVQRGKYLEEDDIIRQEDDYGRS